MNFNFDVPLVAPNGEQATNPFNNQKLRIRDAIYDCLLAQGSQTPVTGDVKLSRGELAVKLSKGGDQNYSVNELKLIRDAVGEAGTVTTVHAVFTMLDGPGDGKKKK